MDFDRMDYGVSRQAIIPVRREPNHRSEQTSQLLFGDHYEVLSSSEDHQWLYIRIFADQYEGWIDKNQNHPITKAYFEQINHANFKITTDLSSKILYKKSPITILMGSIVPISNSELFKMEEQFAFNGESKSLGQRRDYEYLQTVARKYLNAPYQWGGKSPFGIDCSGLVQMVFKICGYSLSRDAWQQVKSGNEVKALNDSQPGDLAFFANTMGEIVHVGIILEGNLIIHSSGAVRIDQLLEDGILNVESKIYTHSLATIRRVLIPNQ